MKLGTTKKTNILLAISFLLVPPILFCYFLAPASRSTMNPNLGALLFAAGLLLQGVSLACFILGCCFYAKGKGHHALWGLLGLFYIPGLVVLALFPDRHKGEDNTSGCLMTLIVFILMTILMMALGIFMVIKIKSAKSAEGQNQIDVSQAVTTEMSGLVLRSPQAKLDERMAVVDRLVKEGPLGIAELKKSLDIIRNNPRPTEDDQTLARRIVLILAAGQIGSPGVMIPSTSSGTAVGPMDAAAQSTATPRPGSPRKKKLARKKHSGKKVKKGKNSKSKKAAPKSSLSDGSQ